MSLEDRGLVQTIRPDYKTGMRIPNEIYYQVAQYIFNLISTEYEPTLAIVLSDVKRNFNHHHDVEVIAYAIKLDLEARGYISLTPSIVVKNQKRLCVTSKGKRYFNSLDFTANAKQQRG